MELSYWTLGEQFLRLAEAACRELESHNNAAFLITDEEATPEQLDAAYKWSDHTIGVPILFNLFHGIELMLKGFIACDRVPPVDHRLSKLLELFGEIYPDDPLLVLLSPVLIDVPASTPLGRFLALNGLAIDDWYQALKYPVSTKGKQYDHLDLKYGGAGAIPFWRLMGDVARDTRVESVRIARSMGLA